MKFNFGYFFKIIWKIAYYLMLAAIIGVIYFLFKNFPKQTKLFLVAYFTMFIIYRLTTPTLQYKPWIVPDDVTEGPPIHLYYPDNPFGWIARTEKKPHQKIPDIDFKLIY